MAYSMTVGKLVDQLSKYPRDSNLMICDGSSKPDTIFMVEGIAGNTVLHDTTVIYVTDSEPWWAKEGSTTL